MIKKCLLHIFAFCTILFSSVYAQRDIRYYEFYDLLGFPLISSISIKYFRNQKEFIYQDQLKFSGLQVQQTTGIVNVYKDRVIENFAKVSYTLDTQRRVIKREHTENQGYSVVADYTYLFNNLLMPIASRYVSSNSRYNFFESSRVQGNEMIFSRKEPGLELPDYLTIRLDSQKRIISSEVKATSKYLGSFGEYVYSKDNSYKILNFQTQLDRKRILLSESTYDSFSRLRRELFYGEVGKECRTTIPGVNRIDEWRYKFDSRGNWIDKAYFTTGCEGVLNGSWRYGRVIVYSK